MKKAGILIGVCTFFAITLFFGGGPAAAWFQDNGDGTVTDTVTGLVWEQVEGENGSSEVTWQEGLDYCANLDRGGMTDWRLPNIREMESLVDENRYDPAIDGVFGYGSIDAWSSTTYSSSRTEAWYVGFKSGLVSYIDKGDFARCARCVRGGPAGIFPPKQFQENGDGTVTDTVTGLVWEQVEGENGSSEVTWEGGLAYCANLDRGGMTDWRLPNIRELESLIDENRYDPAIDGVFGYGSIDAWSSTTYSSSRTEAWYVGFKSGLVSYIDKGDFARCARCVRGGPAGIFPPKQFQENGDGTVTDTVTGLVWEQVRDGGNGSGALSWEAAFAYCESLDHGGRADWRLPNIRELESLVDENRYDPAVDGVFGYGSLNTWSSTTYSSSSGQAWYVIFESGSVSYSDKDGSSYYARCVCGGPSGETTFQWPVDNPNSMSNSYAAFNKVGNNKYHTGFDLTSSTGSLIVRAAASGYVRRVPNTPTYKDNLGMGNVVIIDHNNGKGPFSLYAHLASFVESAQDGQFVSKGTQIGVMGNTGTGDLPGVNIHLHFEVKHWNVLGSVADVAVPQCTDSTSINCNNWGYTFGHPNLYGYINPSPYLDYDLPFITPIAITSTNNQIVRTGPDSTKYKTIVTEVSSGQNFVAFSGYNGWYQIYIPSSYGPASGWIQGTVESSGTILEVNDPDRGLEGVRVRDMPSTSSDNRISYVWDDQLLLEKSRSQSGNGCTKQWYEIYLPDPDGLSSLSGWVCGEYLRLPISSDVVFVNKNDAACGGNSPCYTSIQNAINAATTGTSIKIAQGTYTESITLNESKSLTLQGGWDCEFTIQTPNKTIITQAPKAPQGSLTLQMLSIKP